jgi:hypothetical protein
LPQLPRNNRQLESNGAFTILRRAEYGTHRSA